MFIYSEKNKQTSSSVLLATVNLKFSNSNSKPTFAAIFGVLAIQSSVISG